jgi:mercuric ion transport protein
MPELPLETPAPPPDVGDRPRSGVLAGVGAIVTAFLGSLCCVGPLLFVTLGIGAGLASTFEPLRPVFVGLTVALLGLGFYTVYGRRGGPSDAEVASAPGPSCPARRRRRRDEVVLWSATVLAVVLLSFPAWSKLLV